MKTTIRFESLRAIIIFSVLGLIVACKKDNPPPANNGGNTNTNPPTDLTTHFNGLVDGATLEFTQNVLGYDGAASHNYILLPSPSYSSAVYRFRIASPSSSTAIEIFHGAVYWDKGVSNDPTFQMINTFFQSNLTPAYAADGMDGFEVQYTDNTGAIWRSNEASVNPQNATFSGLSTISNTSGDFTKFTVDFNCYVYNATLTDSIQLQNAQLTGWFQR